MKRSFTAFLVGLALACAPALALAQSAPTHLVQDSTASQNTDIPSAGSCPAGQVAVAFLANTGSRTQSTFVENPAGNTWNAGTEAIQGGTHSRVFWTVVAAGKDITTSTKFQYTLSGSGGSVIGVDCYPSGTAVDGNSADNGAASSSSPINSTSYTASANVQMVVALFLSNRWTSITPNPPTGYLAGTTAMSGATFGIKTFYANVSSGNTGTTGSLSGTSVTTWTGNWIGITTGAGAATRHNLTTTKAGD